MKPPVSILNRDFRYVRSEKTDIRKTFRRLRLVQRAEEIAAAGKSDVRWLRQIKS